MYENVNKGKIRKNSQVIKLKIEHMKLISILKHKTKVQKLYKYGFRFSIVEKYSITCIHV